MTKMSALKRLLQPETICYVGGSQIAGPIRASRRAGFKGEIWVVNPNASEIEGVQCVASVDQLPAAPDAAVVGLSPERSIESVKALSHAGCGGCVVMSSGFAEVGQEGLDLQEELVRAAGDMPLLGPNCMGLINQFSGAAVWGDDNHIERQDGRAAAIISQSGALLIGMTGVEQAFPLGYAISIGNQAGTTAAELVEAVLEDEHIAAIGLYLEGMDDAEPLGRACLKALGSGVPVVALKGGDDAAGAEVAISHTAAMVIERDLWEAFCDRFGIVEVSSPKALVETLKLLTVSGLPEGSRVSIVSYSGGLNGLAATRAGPLGLVLPGPSDANRALMESVLPGTVSIGNPLDLNIPFKSRSGISLNDTQGVAKILTAFAEDVSDQLVFFIDVPRPGAADLDVSWSESLEALFEVREKLALPVSVAGIMPEGLPPNLRRRMHEHGVAALLGFAETMEALAVSVRLSHIMKERRAGPAPEPLMDVGAGIEKASKYAMLDEAASKQILGDLGLRVPPGEAVSPHQAGEAAQKVGFPVALKVLSSKIAHKARVGGVRLNLNSQDEVERAALRMAEDVASSSDGHPIERVLVERMIEDAEAELIVGIKQHQAIGFALMIGQGGSKAEELNRFETLLLPPSQRALDQAFRNLGIDGSAAAPQVLRVCHAISDYVAANAHKLVTLDVNPVILTRTGEAIVADALIVERG